MSFASRGSSRNASIISKKSKKKKRGSTNIKKKILESEAPEGILSLLLTSNTQEIFNLRVDQDVTADDFLRKIKKEDIMKDIFNRAAVSDFKPYKEIIQNFPNDEIIICYDSNFQYGNNFYMATTVEIAKLLLAGPDNTSLDESSEDPPLIYIPPVSKPWLSYGSEMEIEEETVKQRREPISMTISGTNKIMNRLKEFKDRDVETVKDGLINIKSYKVEEDNVKILLYNKSTQTATKVTDGYSQVEWRYPHSKITQYEYRALSETEREEIQMTDSYTQAVIDKKSMVFLSLQQNELFDVFENEWSSLGDINKSFDNKLDIHLKEYQSFSDLKDTTAKIVSCIRWHPLYSGVIAVSLIHDNTYSSKINNEHNMLVEKALILIWSFSDPINPQLILEAPDDVTAFDFNPSNPNYVAAGCMNGNVVVWDISDYSSYLQPQTTTQKSADFIPGYETENLTGPPCCDKFSSTAIGGGHSCAVTDLLWIPSHFELSKNGEPLENFGGFSSQIISCGLDNTLFVFDIRNYRLHQWERERENFASKSTFDYLHLSWKPLLRITTTHKEKAGFYYPVKFSLHESTNYDATKKQNSFPTVQESSQRLYTAEKTVSNSITTMFYAGTDDGDLLYLNWMPEKDFETGKFETPKPEFAANEHYGAITALVRSPFLRDLILCVGGWNFTLWKENFHLGALLKSKKFGKRLTAAEWSPSRPSVFFIGREDGTVDVWDLLDRSHEPVSSQSISLCCLTCISMTIVTKKQHLMAVGDTQAILHIIRVPAGLSIPHGNELVMFKNYVDREIKRRIFVKRRYDLREEEKEREHIEQKKQAGMAPLAVLSKEEIEGRMKLEYTKFLDEEREILFSLGIIND